MSMFNYGCDEVKKIIDEVSPNYPQLTTFEKEWLYFHKYGYMPGTPVELEYATVETSDRATVFNTIPYHYKSAILKGNTKYRDIDTGDILDTFDETKNLELVSVKMPVLTTNGKNLFDGELESGRINATTGENQVNSSMVRSKNFVKVKPSTTYTLSYEIDHGLSNVVFYGLNKEFLGVMERASQSEGSLGRYLNITTTNNTHYIRFYSNSALTITNTTFKSQLEESPNPTTYEPFKSNILTINGDFKLRGINNVKDELNLLTGEMTQRIDEVVLDGSEYWSISNILDGKKIYIIDTDVVADGVNNQISCKNDRVNDISWNDAFKEGKIGLFVRSTGTRGFGLCLSTNVANDVNTLKTWLQQNPITVHYNLATESVKKVILTNNMKPYDGTTHYEVSSNTINPILYLEVPVVSTGAMTIQDIQNQD